MSAIVHSAPSAPRTHRSWLLRLIDAVQSWQDRKRLDAELEALTDERLQDIGVARSDVTTRFRTEMRKVERLGLTDYGRC